MVTHAEKSGRNKRRLRVLWNGNNKLTITDAVYESIAKTIGALPPEQGGLLGGSHDDGIVRHYYFDHSSIRSGVTYSPDHVLLTKLLEEEWNPRGVRLLGFAHSHPVGCARPSGGDLVYAHRILEAIPDLPRLLLPIVTTPRDGARAQVGATSRRLLCLGPVLHDFAGHGARRLESGVISPQREMVAVSTAWIQAMGTPSSSGGLRLSSWEFPIPRIRLVRVRTSTVCDSGPRLRAN